MTDPLKRQDAFAEAIRSGQLEQPELTPEDQQGAGLYRDLVLGNLAATLSTPFPVLISILGELRWQQIVERFLAQHISSSPLFHQLGVEFLQWLAEQPLPEDCPYLYELAHYEWMELELETAPDLEAEDNFDPEADLMLQPPLFSALVRLLNYRYPVHQIGPQQLPQGEPQQQTHLLVYRNREDQVQFMELAPLSALLLEQIEQQQISGETALQQLQQHYPTLAHNAQRAHVQQLLNALQQAGIILGGIVQ